MKSLRILYVGPLSGTCKHRAEALRSLGHEVRTVASGIPSGFARSMLYRVGARLGRPPDLFGANRAVAEAAERRWPDVLWVDKGLTIRPATLRRVRERSPGTICVSYSPDDQMYPTNRSTYWLRGIPLYHLHVTTKSYNVREIEDLGAGDVMFVDNAFEPSVHRPLDLSPADREKYGCDVGFVGGYERDRADAMLDLARSGVSTVVWGYDWEALHERHPKLVVRNVWLDDAEFPKAINATGINLGFLRKHNRDLQTTRSIEIPACGGFLLAERTDEHLALFREGEEAEFFGSTDELLRKCRYYIEHEPERARIARAGLRRCIEAGYRNQDRLAKVLAHLAERHGR